MFLCSRNLIAGFVLQCGAGIKMKFIIFLHGSSDCPMYGHAKKHGPLAGGSGQYNRGGYADSDPTNPRIARGIPFKLTLSLINIWREDMKIVVSC